MEYHCSSCDMGVNGLTCTQCSSPLVSDTITNKEGKKIQVAKCPKDCGMIKSPQCCGHDMGAKSMTASK